MGAAGLFLSFLSLSLSFPGRTTPPASLPMAVSFMVLELLPPASGNHAPVYPCKKPPHPSAVFSFSSSSSLGSFCSLELSVLYEEGGLGTGQGQSLLQQRKGKCKWVGRAVTEDVAGRTWRVTTICCSKVSHSLSSISPKQGLRDA